MQLDTEEVRHSRNGLSLRGKMTNVAARLAAGVKARDAIVMAEQLEEAAKLDMRDSPWSTWEDEVKEAQEVRVCCALGRQRGASCSCCVSVSKSICVYV